MTPHDLLTMYSAKAVEYLIAVAFLLLFIPFWRYVNGEPVPAPAIVAPRWLEQLAGWFSVPDHLYFHPGHAWARVEPGGIVTVGMDDFAHKLVGSVAGISLPGIGTRVGQGERAWSLTSGAKSVDMLSPVDGTVVAVNAQTADAARASGRDPYGEGWLLKVQAPRLRANITQLLSGTLAKRWMEEACDRLLATMSPDLGRVYQDGGLPVAGMAHNIDPENWDQLARGFFLT